jgi:hypothetical protein
MSVLCKIACLQNRKDEVPNQELAKELVETNNLDGIEEIAENLFNKDKNIQSDCIKVLYEAGYIKPEIIAEYVGDFIKLLRNRNNRLVWGAMIALSIIASIKADEIYENIETVYEAIKEGSVITVDNGIKVLAAIASQNDEYDKNTFPFLINHLKTCRPKEVGQHAESIFIAVNPSNQDEFINVLKEREISLSSSQLARVKKLYRKLQRN